MLKCEPCLADLYFDSAEKEMSEVEEFLMILDEVVMNNVTAAIDGKCCKGSRPHRSAHFESIRHHEWSLLTMFWREIGIFSLRLFRFVCALFPKKIGDVHRNSTTIAGKKFDM